jgi:hypothetical protein
MFTFPVSVSFPELDVAFVGVIVLRLTVTFSSATAGRASATP